MAEKMVPKAVVDLLMRQFIQHYMGKRNMKMFNFEVNCDTMERD